MVDILIGVFGAAAMVGIAALISGDLDIFNNRKEK